MTNEPNDMPDFAPSRWYRPCQPRQPVGLEEDREFLTIGIAFARYGGLVTADELVRSLRLEVPQPLSVVGRWIAERTAVQFASGSQTWFPRFQFEGIPMSVRPEVCQIVQELRDAFDDRELALWFAGRNVWLDYKSPVESIEQDAAAVVQAARVDRFIAKG